MGLFKSKPKISIEECCKQFYDSQIFHATIHGADLWSGFLDAVSKSLAEADPSFSAFDPGLYRQEMTALRMEVFALACSQKVKREDLALRQSFSTRHYLEEGGRVDIWDIMGEYNQAIAQSAKMTANGGQTGRGHVVKVDKLRVDIFEKWAEEHTRGPDSFTQKDEENAVCVARAANRIGAEMRRADCIAVKRLGARLADRLGCDINLRPEALFRMAATIFGFYTGAEDYLKPVSLE